MKTINYDHYKQLRSLVSVLIKEDILPTIAIGGFLIEDIQLIPNSSMMTFHSSDDYLWLITDFTDEQIVEMISILEEHLIKN